MGNHSYTIYIGDSDTDVYMGANLSENAPEGSKTNAVYTYKLSWIIHGTVSELKTEPWI